MAKRGASVQLTDSNWDSVDEPEQAGHFNVAGEDEISKRIFKKAKRRVPESGEKSSGFKGFQGFGVVPNMSSPPSTSTNIFTGLKGFGNSDNKQATDISTDTADTGIDKSSDSVFMTRLKRLNQEVCEWIKKHISENPYVDLSPVFKDYEKHMVDLEKRFSSDDCQVEVKQTDSTTTGAVKGFWEFTNNMATREQSNVQGNDGPLTNGDSSRLSSDRTSEGKSSEKVEEADDTPKTESQVKSAPEDDAFYSVRCKLFFKRAEDWAELGVGMLNLKKVKEKTQVLMRNDTALGKILLNVFIGESTLTSRSGKNNVLFMSLPNPPVFNNDNDKKPVSYLIRVKTAEDADKLQDQLQAAKESA